MPPNITLLPPPKSPERTVMENVWQFVRDNWLSNHAVATQDAIVTHGDEAWNKFISQLWHIRST